MTDCTRDYSDTLYTCARRCRRQVVQPCSSQTKKKSGVERREKGKPVYVRSITDCRHATVEKLDSILSSSLSLSLSLSLPSPLPQPPFSRLRPRTRPRGSNASATEITSSELISRVTSPLAIPTLRYFWQRRQGVGARGCEASSERSNPRLVGYESFGYPPCECYWKFQLSLCNSQRKLKSCRERFSGETRPYVLRLALRTSSTFRLFENFPEFGELASLLFEIRITFEFFGSLVWNLYLNFVRIEIAWRLIIYDGAFDKLFNILWYIILFEVLL